MLRCTAQPLSVALFIACVVGTAAAQPPAPLDDADRERNTPLEIVPADAVFVARLAKPIESLDRIRAFLHASSLVSKRGPDPFAGLAAAIGNPALDGVDEVEDWWCFGLPSKQGPPTIVFAIPTDGVSAAKRVLDTRFGRENVLRRGIWMVYSASKDATSHVRDVFDGKSPALEATITSEQRKLLLEGEIAVHVDASAFNTKTTEGPGPIDAAMGRLGLSTEQMESVRAVIPELAPFADAIAKLTASFRIGPAGIDFELLASPSEAAPRLMASDGPQPSSFGTLPRLPEEQLLYVGASGLAGPAARRVVAHVVEGTPRRLELRKRLAALLEELKTVEIEDVVGSIGLGRVEGGALRVVKVVDAKPRDEIRSLVRREFANTAFELVGTAQSLEITENGVQRAGITADGLRLTVRRDAPHRDWIEALYGRDGLVGHVAFERERVVQVLGGGEEFGTLVHRRLADRTGRLGNGDLLATRNKLPERAHLLALVDVPSTMIGITRVGLRGRALEAGVDPRSLDGYDRNRSYCGVSLGLEPDGVRFAVVVPVDQIKRTRSVLEFLSSRFRLTGS